MDSLHRAYAANRASRADVPSSTALIKGRAQDFMDKNHRIKYDEGEGWQGYGADKPGYGISHWMPLPEPPPLPSTVNPHAKD